MVTLPWSETELAAAKARCTEMLSSIPLNYEPTTLTDPLCCWAGFERRMFLKALASAGAILQSKFPGPSQD
jgi:hypothetical protein